MRVVAGKAKGSKLQSVPGNSTRPILDRVKTALFDILRPELNGATILDLFAGSGSVGIEALSQGASHSVFIDNNKKAVQTISDNLNKTGLTPQASIHQIDALKYLASTPLSFELIYIAPPQYKKIWIAALQAVDKRPELLSMATAQVIIQIDPKEWQEVELQNLREYRQKKYGNTLLLFYQRPTRKNSSLTT